MFKLKVFAINVKLLKATKTSNNFVSNECKVNKNLQTKKITDLLFIINRKKFNINHKVFDVCFYHAFINFYLVCLLNLNKQIKMIY